MIIRCREMHTTWRVVSAAVVVMAGLLLLPAARVAAAPGTWVIQTSPNAPAAVQSVLFSDSCVSATFCVAVGVGESTGDIPLIEMWNGSAWSVASTSLGAEVLDSVSCTSTTFCMAVSGGGPADGFAGPTEMEAVWNGTTWTTVAPAIPAGATVIEGLQGVSCTAPTACTAVGWYAPTGQVSRPVVETWNGATWTAVTSPDPNPSTATGYSQLNGVSCTATMCEAVGDQNTGGFAEDWNGASWTLQTVPAGTGFLAAVSCPTNSACEAVGQNLVSPVTALAMGYNGTTWTSQPTPASTINLAESWGVTCTTPTDCVAVGEDSKGGVPGPGNTRIDGWNGATWTPLAHPATTGDISGNRGLLGVSCTTGICTAVGDQVVAGNENTLVESTSNGAAPPQGFDLAGSDGGVFTYGSAPFHGSLAGTPLTAPIVGIAVDRATGGYWLASANGGVVGLGAPSFGSAIGFHLNQPIAGIAATPAGDGYDLVARDGGVFAFGGAQFHGSMAGMPLAAPVVGITIDPATGGYWLTGSDGGVFALGAPFLGSAGGAHLAKPVVGIDATAAGDGYDLAASDGGVFTYGAAPFHGSGVGAPLSGPVVGIAIDQVTGGYWLTGSDGSVLDLGAPNLGSAVTIHLNGPIVGISST